MFETIKCTIWHLLIGKKILHTITLEPNYEKYFVLLMKILVTLIMEGM